MNITDEEIKKKAAYIYFDLATKAMQVMKENNMNVEELTQSPEVKKIWAAMDVIEEYYLSKD